MATTINSEKLGDLNIDNAKVLTDASIQDIQQYVCDTMTDLSANILQVIKDNIEKIMNYVDGKDDDKYIVGQSDDEVV